MLQDEPWLRLRGGKSVAQEMPSLEGIRHRLGASSQRMGAAPSPAVSLMAMTFFFPAETWRKCWLLRASVVLDADSGLKVAWMVQRGCHGGWGNEDQ